MLDSIARRPTTMWFIALAIGFGTILVASILVFGTFWGDPVIYLPYARNNAAGDFFSFNPGQFSSGATSPLWSLILALPYFIGADVAGAKVVSIAFTLGAFAVLALMTARFNGRSGGPGIALLYAVEMMTLFGLMMYESPLIVIGVALTLIVGDTLIRSAKSDVSLSSRTLWLLAAVWAILPLARPEASVLVPLQIGSMWIAHRSERPRMLRVLIIAAVVASIPSLLYYGASHVLLGSFSVSSKCRAFALMESADRIGPIVLSRSALTYIGSILFALVIAVVGLDHLRRDRTTSWVGIYGVAAIAVYVVLLVFVQPVTNDLPRYFLPIAPFVVLGAGRALASAESRIEGSRKVWAASIALLVLVFVVRAPMSVLAESFDQSRRGYTFDEIVEREVVERVNRIARPGDRVLAYEVQARYYLRPDVSLLSLDGITDGKVAPYLATADMGAFLNEYQPRYWIANNAGSYRPYLKRSMLQRALNALSTRSDSAGAASATYREEGITFTRLDTRRRAMPRGFAGWTMLVELAYDKPIR